MPGVILARAGQELERIRTAWRAGRHDAFLAEARHALLHRYADALTRLLPSTPFTMDDLITAGLLPRHRRFTTALLDLLHEHGLAHLSDEEQQPPRPTTPPPSHDQWHHEAAHPHPDEPRHRSRSTGRWRLTVPADPDELTRTLLLRHPAHLAETALTTHLTRRLPALLRGEQNPTAPPAHQGFPEPFDNRLLRHLYDVAPVCRFTNRTARALLSQIIAAWPSDRPLRVLEIGAGTGGTTAALLPLLSAHLTHYTFTDPCPAACAAAPRRFSGHDFLDYRPLDLDTDPTTQGFTSGAHDLVIAANALHTARDLPAALDRVRSLLTPGGHLLAIETHDPCFLLGLLTPFLRPTHTSTVHTPTAHTMTARTMTGHAWAAENDPLRPGTPLLRREQWPPLLRECGFTDIAQTGPDTTPARDAFSILLAARPRAHARPLPTAPPSRPTRRSRFVIHEPPRPGMVAVEIRAATFPLTWVERPDDPRTSRTGASSQRGSRTGDPSIWRWGCAGVVTAIGEGVTGLRPGERVTGLAPGTPTSHALTSARLLTAIPAGMTDAEAATVPLAHLHAHLALTVQAKLSPDETLLLRDDATGLGLATLRHALQCGARVIVAARTPAQRDLLLALGAWRTLDAQDPRAPRRVLELTDGRGAEVAAGPVPPGWERALAGEGRYVQLGLADPSEPGLFAEVMAGLPQGRVLPLPFSAFPAARVQDALALIREGRQLGEIVLCFDPMDGPVPACP
ncbi:methyltransferase [Nonomuraea sp. FMUSA5-5]|uniref:Methyltransferase n=1 Tax=Nonomuraea composti TaxID=2720023 RepID=A0ABX1BCR5_9ACTN|nr:methyltransferase [Nonomuraea sp. FMUSA5-5]NJP94607.1 methyltransferase [Nonomuraea sp. FMUSA5-5]